MAAGSIKSSFFTDSVAAVSAGVWEGRPILDLNYAEDKDAAVDANIVLTGAGRFVEIQSSGEEATFSQDELTALVALARHGAAEITSAQQRALASG
jgi:ribonuclease PH